MSKPQFAILRFAKYKGPEIGHIESHNERTKEKYASNPDVDTSRSHLNFHLIMPQRKYRAEAEKQIAEAGCRTRSDSVRVVEALVTASPEFFKGKKKGEIKAYFTEALDFIREHQDPKTIISAVVHMDEKTPHMHLCFVPLTADGRLSAKEIVGNKKKLTQWQDEFWKHMVKKYPDLERGESASETGRDHIPPRLFKEAVHLNRMKEQILKLMTDTNLLNKKSKMEELEAMQSIFARGVYVAKNTSQSASVEFVRFRRTNSARGRLQAFCQKRALPFFDSLKRPEPSAPSAFLPYFPVSGRGNRVQGQTAGGWWVNTISRPVSGWVKPSRQAHRARVSPSPAPPYFRSPTRGKPRPANCTRIWWVRPVCRVTRTRDSPSRTASVS